jgi:hypothetical protein
MKKIAPFLAVLCVVSLSGCISAQRESGKRTNILFGLVDYKNDYHASGYVYDSSSTIVGLNGAALLSSPSGAGIGHAENVEGKKLSILWGLFTFNRE